MEKVRRVVHLGGQRANVDKFQALHLKKEETKLLVVKSSNTWGSQKSKTKYALTQFKLMGCTANPLGGWGIISANPRQRAARARSKLAARPVS